MNTMHIDPRDLIVDQSAPPDSSYMELIQEDGLPAHEGALPSITVRMAGERYAVVTGGKIVRAIVALIEIDAERLKTRDSQMGSPAKVYRTVPVGLLG